MFIRILLNSLWGKFGQRNQLPQNRVLKDPGDFYKLMLNKKVCVGQIIPVELFTIRVTYIDKKLFVSEHKALNVLVALWTTRLIKKNLAFLFY
jgi:hypothetical protein